MNQIRHLQGIEKRAAEAASTPTDIVGRIEPGVLNRPPFETHSFIQSIAISLKRIADIMEKNSG